MRSLEQTLGDLGQPFVGYRPPREGTSRSAWLFVSACLVVAALSASTGKFYLAAGIAAGGFFVLFLDLPDLFGYVLDAVRRGRVRFPTFVSTVGLFVGKDGFRRLRLVATAPRAFFRPYYLPRLPAPGEKVRRFDPFLVRDLGFYLYVERSEISVEKAGRLLGGAIAAAPDLPGLVYRGRRPYLPEAV